MRSRRPQRGQAAVERVRKYAGLEPGYQPICTVARARMQRQMDKPAMLYPSASEVETALARSAQIVKDMQGLLQGSHLRGWQEPFEKLKQQLGAYDSWLKESVLPKARQDFRLSPEGLSQVFLIEGDFGDFPRRTGCPGPSGLYGHSG